MVGGIVGGAAYALTTDDFEWREFGGAVAGGAVVGAVAGIAGPLGGSVAASFGLSATGGAATAATVGINALGGLAGSWVQAEVGYGRAPTAGEMLWGAGTAAFGGWIGDALFPTVGMSTLRQAQYFAPRTWAGLVSGKANISAIYKAAIVSGFWEVGANIGLDQVTEAVQPYQSNK